MPNGMTFVMSKSCPNVIDTEVLVSVLLLQYAEGLPVGKMVIDFALARYLWKVSFVASSSSPSDSLPRLGNPVPQTRNILDSIVSSLNSRYFIYNINTLY